MVLTLFHKYRLSLPVDTQPRVWAIVCSVYICMISEQTRSGKRHLSDKMRATQNTNHSIHQSINQSINQLIYHTVCFKTGPYPLQKRLLLRVGFSASTFNFQYLPAPLRSSNSCLCLLPRLSVPYIFPSIMYFRGYFLHKTWKSISSPFVLL